MTEDSKKDRKLRHMVVMCVLVVLPYSLFMIALGVAPAALASNPASGSVITVAIYYAVVLFLWPIAMAVVFIKGTGKQ